MKKSCDNCKYCYRDIHDEPCCDCDVTQVQMYQDAKHTKWEMETEEKIENIQTETLFKQKLSMEELEVQRLTVVDVVCKYLRYNAYTLKYEICEADLANDQMLMNFVNAVHQCTLAKCRR